MMDFIKLLIALFSFIAAYFIYDHGTMLLEKAHFGVGTTPHTLVMLIVLLPILIGLLLVLGLMKSLTIKYIPPLLVLNGLAIAYFVSKM